MPKTEPLPMVEQEHQERAETGQERARARTSRLTAAVKQEHQPATAGDEPAPLPTGTPPPPETPPPTTQDRQEPAPPPPEPEVPRSRRQGCAICGNWMSAGGGTACDTSTCELLICFDCRGNGHNHCRTCKRRALPQEQKLALNKCAICTDLSSAENPLKSCDVFASSADTNGHAWTRRTVRHARRDRVQSCNRRPLQVCLPRRGGTGPTPRQEPAHPRPAPRRPRQVRPGTLRRRRRAGAHLGQSRRIIDRAEAHSGHGASRLHRLGRRTCRSRSRPARR